MAINRHLNIITKAEGEMLKAFRYFLLAFTEENQAHWETAMSISKALYGDEKGREVGFAMLRVLQAVRKARDNAFLFVNPYCKRCSYSLPDCERYLMETIRSVANDNMSAAYVPALLLCEGTDVDEFLRYAKNLTEQTMSN